MAAGDNSEGRKIMGTSGKKVRDNNSQKNVSSTLPPYTDEQVPPLKSPTEEPSYKLYLEHLKQAWADCQSSSDEFDKSILAYSSAGLGISLVFIKEIVPLANEVGLILLYASWILFGVAILATVISFQLSVMSQNKHVEHLQKYYLEKKTDYLNPPNKAAVWVGRLKWVSGICFMLATIGIIVFSIWNLMEEKHMSGKVSNDTATEIQNGRSPMIMTKVGGSTTAMDGRSPMSMTPLEKGRQPMTMTPLPSNPAPTQPSQNVSPPQMSLSPKNEQ